MNIRKAILALACSLTITLSGCAPIAVGAYPDTSLSRASAADLTQNSEPLKLKLEVEWQMNGHPPSREKGFMELEIPPPDMNMLRQKFTEAFQRTGMVEIVQERKSGMGTVTVTLNNVSDIGDAIDKGTQLGKSWGDGHVTTKEEFELSLLIERQGATARSSAVRGAYYSVTAKSKLPDDARLRPPRQVFDDMLEQMLIKCLLDMQRSGGLAELTSR
ncbi:hypothetical protein Herbaro_06940 [Herbaspirillum sp. WKF16]|uniref:hypothetical protein n=1 Tax=Herbaspirillum sp. WKF16 TaxID=3028312 RepID=UPI0023A9CF6E|nr:hypothetical protein [Herbaspirillum sp. WKF16]WDZ97521.1 hypothetical protein Herbaro_06940 [Herbaspirillum sp. WKF16]